jgi:DNA-binding NtrC family response regulator
MLHDRGTILVVDDKADVRHPAKKLLEIAGYTVITAAGGVEVGRALLNMEPEVSVVLMSCDSSRDNRSLEYLAKPFRPTELIETVSRVLSMHTHSRKAAAHTAC